MSWTDRIAGCFGCTDKIFAGHSCDCQRAAEMLSQANKEDVGWKDYQEKIKDWLISQGCSQEHIDNQMERVVNLRNYLNYD